MNPAALRLCGVDEVAENAMRRAEIEGHAPFAVYNVAGTFYVTQDMCTHGAASLSEEGELEDHFVVCSWHGGMFDLRTGAACAMPCTIPLRTYAVSVRDGGIWIDPA